MANLVATTITGNLDVTGGGVITGDGSGLSGVDPFASGTKMVFYQASAPTGWTQDTAAALSNTVMSIVTGTGGGTGGSTSYFSSFLATTDKSGTDTAPVTGTVAGTVGNHTLSTPQIPSHNHSITGGLANTPGAPFPVNGMNQNNINNGEPLNTANAGGGGSHSHPFSGSLSSATADVSVTVPAANVKYANVIVATKD
jgi:hypothetical protein